MKSKSKNITKIDKSSKKTCFVIMPISTTDNEHTDDYWKDHFDTFLKPIIKDANKELEIIRSEPLREDLLSQILLHLSTSDIVVADITSHNPNVLWELGVRQSFKHGTITIIEDGNSIPFDIVGKGTLKYFPKSHIKNQEFIDKFKKAIKNCLEFPEKVDSRVLEVLGGRGSIVEIFKKDETIRRLDALISECERNMQILKKTKVACDKHQKINKSLSLKQKKAQYTYIVGKMRLVSIELLIAQRYVDGDIDFYSLAENYYDRMHTFNYQIDKWGEKPDRTEKYILKVYDGHVKVLDLFKKISEKNKERLI